MRLEKLQASSAYSPMSGWAVSARQQIDEYLDALLHFPNPSRVNEAMRYSVLGGGKRIRPMLALAVADYLGTRPPGLMHVACAIEMIHAASLILDDLPCMDNDRMRRNRPSTHAVYGEDCAILASVSLLMHCHAMLASHPDLPPEARLKTIRLLCETIGADGLSLGQYIDLSSRSAPLQAAATAGAHHLKTGILFLAAAKAACLLCDATPEQSEKITVYATSLGLAFQLKDDLADVGEPGLNLAAAMGVTSARRQFLDHLETASDAIGDDDDAGVLRDFAEALLD